MDLRLVEPARAREYFRKELDFTTGPVELNRVLRDNPGEVNVIDVREATDFWEGHVPGAKNLPQRNWSDLSVLSSDKINVVYCYSAVCHLGKKAALAFAEAGFSVVEMDGGFKDWKANDLPVVSSEAQESFQLSDAI